MSKNYLTILLDNNIYSQRNENSKIKKLDLKGNELDKYDNIPSEIEHIVTLYKDIEENPNKYLKYEYLPDDTVKILKILDKPNITTHFKVPEFINGRSISIIGEHVLEENLRINLKQIDLPDSILFMFPSAFSDAISLETFYVPRSVQLIADKTFLNCKSLKQVYLNNVSDIRKAAFESCKNLKSIDLSNINYLGSCAFMFCESLRKIKLSEKLSNIQLATFFGCKSLSKIVIPDNIINIDNEAFAYCDELKDITIGNNTKYHEDAFTFRQKLCIKIKKELEKEDKER